MKKLGILCHEICATQKLMCIFQSLNELSLRERDIDCILFHNDLGINPIRNEFAIMQSVEALDYDGTLIATDIIMAYLLKSCLGTNKKYFYIWDLDWNVKSQSIDMIKLLYLNPEIELIARSSVHADILTKLFKKPKFVIEDFYYEQLKTIV